MLKITITVSDKHPAGHMVAKSTRIIEVASCADYSVALQSAIADQLEQYIKDVVTGLDRHLEAGK